MENVTLEKVDMIRERTGVSYEKAKEALEKSEGDVLEALIYIEKAEGTQNNENEAFDDDSKTPISIEELKAWFKQTIEKGNVTRIKIKKDDTELIDIPVNAGIAAGVVAIIIPPILAAGVIAAIATQITIEITKEDGSVEVINKYVSEVASNVKNAASDFADIIKSKVSEIKHDYESNKKDSDSNQKVYSGSETVYSYTVNFDEEKENSEN
ncbi:DUF4342 domain-containing protein [Clostridium sp.]|uniref:DUF4342 domain-containing protein n=1 Tax=Clostridium sp. TaxID=1506 RepID=UPI00263215B6|nr:DUF4342 domain-containing protein [Clostridium sp.]